MKHVFRYGPLLGLSFFSHVAFAAELKVLAGAAFAPALKQLGPQFEQATHNTLKIKYVIAGPAKEAIDSGQPFDVIILDAGFLQYAAAKGSIEASSQIEVARIGMAVAAKAGSPVLEMKTEDEFKTMLVSAESLAYPPAGTVGAQMKKIATKFGLADEVAKKTKPQKTVAAVATALSSGEAQFGFAPKTVLLQATGVQILGDFPPDLQTYIVYVAGLGAHASNHAAAQALIDSWKAPAARELMVEKGFDLK
jgi:molybdate transport system substrate-binding protein